MSSGPKPLLICLLFLEILVCIVIYYACVCIRRHRQRCHHRPRSSPARQPGPVMGPCPTKREIHPRGLDPAVVDTFPIIPCSALKDTTEPGSEGCGPALECAVCLSSFREDQTLRFIPKCEHVFHPDCVDPWLRVNSTCPYCRADLGPAPCQSDGSGSGSGSEDEPGSVVIVVVTESNDEKYTLRLSEEAWRKILADDTCRILEDRGRVLAGERCPPMGRRGGDEETRSMCV